MSELLLHRSDCAIHNAPACPAGPCDCELEYRLRTALAESEKDKAALALAAAAMREQAAKVADEFDCLPPMNASCKWPDPPPYDERWIKACAGTGERTVSGIADEIRALPLPDPTALSAKVYALVRAAQRAYESYLLYGAVSEHDLEAALQPLRDAGFGGEK